jgi:hypothetical protein
MPAPALSGVGENVWARLALPLAKTGMMFGTYSPGLHPGLYIFDRLRGRFCRNEKLDVR